jgi:hypothetical protein
MKWPGDWEVVSSPEQEKWLSIRGGILFYKPFVRPMMN